MKSTFDEEKETVSLRAQLKSKIDISPKMTEDFKKFYKTNLDSQIDDLAKKGTEEIF